MTIRTRLIIVILVGLAITIAAWGWMQLRAIDRILVDQQGKRLFELAETISQYYIHFPTGAGLSALDNALREHLMLDTRLARLDIFSLVDNEIDYIAGASRIFFEWPEAKLKRAGTIFEAQYARVETEGGHALGLLYPILYERQKKTYVGILSYSRSYEEILDSAQRLLLLSSTGLILVILIILAVSYRWLIERPLKVIIAAINNIEKGRYLERIPLQRRDEWGLLARHFNSMADRIEQVMTSNRELTRSLEERVQEATHKVIQLQKQVNQLQQLTALGYLTARLAHDMGTPLHSIAGLTRLLLEQDQWSPEVSRKLKLIVQQTERLNETIANVRHATQLPDPHFEYVALADLMNETIPLVEPLLSREGIKLIVELDPKLPHLYVDRHRIQTAIFNLIQNASEALSGKGTITIRGQVRPERNHLILSVEDTGRGIPDELRERVLEPFFSTHTGEGLRGLGLTIVQDIIKNHQGHMEINNMPGKGMCVALYLPLPESPLFPGTGQTIQPAG